MSTGDIDDAEPPHADRDALVEMVTVVVWPR